MITMRTAGWQIDHPSRKDADAYTCGSDGDYTLTGLGVGHGPVVNLAGHVAV